MAKFKLTPTAIKLISKAIDTLFDSAQARLLGPGGSKVFGKQLVIRGVKGSLTHLFNEAAYMEGVKPREEVLRGLLKVSGSYLNASREKAKAKVIQNVNAFIQKANASGKEVDVPTVLGGQMSQVFSDISKDIKRIVETETTIVRNTSLYDAIGRVGASQGEEDPTVFFIVVRDDSLCEECHRLHLLGDGITPKVYKQSQLGGGYHTKGENNPKIGGLHPHCRCVLTILLKGFGFDKAGKVTYISPDHDEYKKQRG